MNNEIIPNFDDDHDESLKITLEKIDERGLILALDGYIDTYNSTFFQTHVTKAIESGFLHLIFDCSQLTYVSSTGIGAFSIFLKTIKPQGGNIVLVGMNAKVFEVFQLLGFSQFFVIKDTVDEAKAFFTSETGEVVDTVFPKLLACPVCHKQLKFARAGRYRCSICKTILTVDVNGSISLG
ncbi:MAG: STAS domain-containing protein [Spirochaetaceae bacterium]|nr:STAS domain-containing protein [Spirochaetaceae bacterium]